MAASVSDSAALRAPEPTLGDRPAAVAEPPPATDRLSSMPLLIKLLLVNVAAIGIALCIAYLAVDYFAADYFMRLMDMYEISPTDTHNFFLEAVHVALALAGVLGLAVAGPLCFWLTRRVLRPLDALREQAERLGRGHYDAELEVRGSGEMRQLSTAFNRMVRSLRRMDQMQRALLADVAHELRTPLTNLTGYTEAMRDGVIKPEPAVLGSLHEESQSLNQLIERLLSLARAEASREKLDLRECELMPIVTELLAKNAPKFMSRGIKVSLRAQKRLMVTADPSQMERVLANLVENAWVHTPPDSRVEIRLYATELGVCVRFTSFGVELQSADTSRLFDRFYRPDKSRARSTGGLGLGLAIVAELVRAHGGTVGAASTKGATQIWFVMPSA